MTKVLFDLSDGTALFQGAQGNSQRPFTGFLVIIVLKAHSTDLLQNTVPSAVTFRRIEYLMGIAYLLRDAQSLVIVQPVRDRAFAVHIPLGSDDVCKIIIAKRSSENCGSAAFSLFGIQIPSQYLDKGVPKKKSVLSCS